MAGKHRMVLNLLQFLSLIMGLEGLSLWIDRKQVKEFMGPLFNLGNIDIPVIENDQVATLLLNPEFEQYLPVINSSVNLVNLTWESGIERRKYGYWFSDLRSMKRDIMYDPLLSIPVFGYVPLKETVFQMAISCTGRQTGVAPFIITLHVDDESGRPLEGFPIKLHFRKHCTSFSKEACDMRCLNGGKCNEFGLCACQPNYYGAYCELTNCLCRNNATCGPDGGCRCSPGYTGKYCGQAICAMGCAHSGRCIAPNKCWCPPGYNGDHCLYKSCSTHCANGGTCIDGQCVCPYGFQGTACQKVLCKKSCGLHGMCVGIDRCRCQPGWHGKYCHATFTYGLKRKKDKKKLKQQRRLERLERRRKKRTHRKQRLNKMPTSV